ncbi:(d)CMP kinase [Rhodoluna lacicola]|jgi:cytidylate kinase|uniref:Cytidylate kinase n=1 Tax=Rhodoluna lacicola TaxID=529884 RepID=A0A060JND4_9MICO|nr:(d)CMP kinase [Rhodoluna lacicola]AIC47689.1 cytidylate kinase [Rhodoluna lacicola]
MATKIIAIDGPAGSGKSSVSKQVARELGFGYLDTGAAYRALAWACLSHDGFSVDQLSSLNLAQVFDYQISTDPDNFWVKVGNNDVTAAIREPQVAEFVSQVARIPEVRSFMKALTHRLVAESGKPAVVVEGRDITTVVAPDAPIRLLLTASEEVRLKRRSAELSESSAASVMRQVSERDASDSKVVDFMTPAPGVQLVDTSDLNFNQSVSAVIALIEQGLS